MEICTPLATKPNGMTAHNTYLYPLNGPELEMEVTPCVRTYAKSKNRQNNKLLTYSASQNNQVLIRKNGNEEATLELDYSVSEAEEMFRNASLRTDPHKTLPTLSDLPKHTEDRSFWVFFENVLKGFDDPQLG